jgi:4-amino-4-deoxy-L-arabinose transferase-like glycosyltransferase
MEGKKTKQPPAIPETQPILEEPSVLDYLKSQLRFWDPKNKIRFPAEGSAPPPSPAPKPRVPSAQRPAAAGQPNRWPWRSLLALFFALLGQRAFEPSPTRTGTAGLVLYAIGLAWLVLAYLREEWRLPPLPAQADSPEGARIKRLPLLLAVPLGVSTFIAMGGDEFTAFNTALWAAAILCTVWAFWQPGPRARPDQERAGEGGSAVSGNVLANDRLRGKRVSVTAARQGSRRIKIGEPFATGRGGTLTLQADGDYSYTPPAHDRVPAGGLQETFVYTLTGARGATSSSRLTLDVSDRDLPNAPRPFWRRAAEFLGRGSWQITVTRWTLLVALAAGLVIFFRVYNLQGIPVEPFSDHAEKIEDVYDVTQGQTRIFFPRNTGREAIQMYLTVAVAWLFRTGLSFLSLKIGTVICGLLTLPYMYKLGREFGGRRVGLLALLFAGIAYWPNVISRVGLRFPLYPLFVAPALYYLVRGLRTRSRNDFIFSGLFLGLGLHGYSPIRILPFVIVIAVGLYLLHAQSKGNRRQAVVGLVLLAVVSLVVFLPLGRYWLDHPGEFSYRALSRLGDVETALPAPAWQVFISNTWNALRMFNWDDGQIWVHSVTGRPALDVVSGSLFIIGIALVLIRYVRERHWQDLFLLLALPLLQMPSILSLAYPDENPALNRAAGAMVPAFLLVAVGLEGLLAGVEKRMRPRAGAALTWALALGLVLVSSLQNYDLVFDKYALQFKGGAWNSSQMGAVIKQFGTTYGTTDSAWIVPYPHWVDTRLPGVWAGIPNRDFALWPEQLEMSLTLPGPKLFILKPEDEVTLDKLHSLYPRGVVSTYPSDVVGHEFLIYFVPPEQ